ncbi:hypothetical protein GGS24DRAFT_466766 [Hypoxylon argillaceum]|nr:hypothetical protein GGS24DRAFT_466766 [Hypoxylon argillaceum]
MLSHPSSLLLLTIVCIYHNIMLDLSNLDMTKIRAKLKIRWEHQGWRMAKTIRGYEQRRIVGVGRLDLGKEGEGEVLILVCSVSKACSFAFKNQ